MSRPLLYEKINFILLCLYCVYCKIFQSDSCLCECLSLRCVCPVRRLGINWSRTAANPHMACESALPAIMDEQALMGLNPNADACYRQRVRAKRHIRPACGLSVNIYTLKEERWVHHWVSKTQSSLMFSVCFQALAYFEQLKESLDGWEVCAEALVKGVYKWV